MTKINAEDIPFDEDRVKGAYFTIYRDNEFHLMGEITKADFLFIHLDVDVWKMSTYKRMLNVWAMALNGLSEMGYEYIYTIVPSDKEKIVKWQYMWGFEPKFMLYSGDKEAILFEQRI